MYLIQNFNCAVPCLIENQMHEVLYETIKEEEQEIENCKWHPLVI